jgi:hypothetical protein
LEVTGKFLPWFKSMSLPERTTGLILDMRRTEDKMRDAPKDQRREEVRTGAPGKLE